MEPQLSQIPSALRAVIVNAFPLTTIALASSIRTIVPELDVRVALTPKEAEPHLHDGGRAALVVLDVDAHRTYGMSVLDTLRGVAPAARIVILSGAHDPRVVEAARELGAAGYISKLASIDAIGNAFRRVLAGTSAFVRDTVASHGVFEPRTAATARAQITPKQAEVLALLCEGMPNKLIGRRLAIQPSTVKAHVSALLRAYAVRSRAELVARVHRAKLR